MQSSIYWVCDLKNKENLVLGFLTFLVSCSSISGKYSQYSQISVMEFNLSCCAQL